MKYFIGFCLCLCALFMSCGSARKRGQALQEWLQPNEKIKVLCTTEMVADVVRSVGGDRVDSLTLITGELDPHSYELVKGDAEKFTVADVVFYNGLGLEHGASLYAQLKGHKKSLAVANAIEKNELIRLGEQIDPHVWMDLMLWIKTIDPVVEMLSSVDADHASYYLANGEALKATFFEEDKKIESLLQSIPEERRYIVTTHDAFNYFTRRYLSEADEKDEGRWKMRCSAPEGLAPESQMSMQDIISICDYLVLHKIPVVFPESNLSTDSLKKVASICRERGSPVLISTKPLYGDAIGGKDEQADSYFGMMRVNAKTIHEYLTAEEI